MIKYNGNNAINDWNYGTSNLIKVYRNGAVCFYKVTGGGDVPTAQTPCYAVVDDISQYSDTEFEDVYDKATEKWYKLNNLNEYEEYGIYGSGRTSCEGSTSRLPQGYTEVEYIENTSTAYINTEVLLYDSTTNSYNIQCKCYFQPYGNDFEYLFGTEGTSSPYVGVNLRYYQRNIQYASNPENVSWAHIDNGDGTSGITASCSSTTATNGNKPLTLFCGLWSTGPWRNGRGKIYSFKVTKNDTLVKDLVPCKRDSDDKYGMYDLITDTFYVSPNNVDFSGGEPIAPTDCVTTYNGKLTIDDGYEYEWNGSSWVNVGEVSGSTYPMYYTAKSDPPDNLVFSSMTEAESYECPWVGMHARIDGDSYIFSGDSQSGYEWVYNPSRLPSGYTEVEYIENTSTSYINTGFKPNQDTRIIAEMQCVTSTNSVMHFGAGGWNRVDGMWLTYETGINGTLHVAWLGKTTWSTYGKGDYNKHTYDWNKNVLYKDETLVGSSTYGTYQSLNNLAIFANLQGEENEYVGGLYMKGKMYSFKIYDNGTLVRDFIPCTRDSDSKAGVYDIVNDVFYLSPNNVDFSGGSPV